MHDTTLLAYTALVALLTVTPGADTFLVLKNVLSGGRGSGVATAAGACCGVFVHAAFSALGVSVVLMRSAELFHAVKLAGAAYLVWLGLRALWATLHFRDDGADVCLEGRGGKARSALRSYREGLVTNVLNPKVAVFYLAVLPQFVQPGDPVLLKSWMLAGIHATLGIVWLAGLSCAFDRARSVLLGRRARRTLEGVSGMVLMAFGIGLAVESR